MVLQNKRNHIMLQKFPELLQIYTHVNRRCILDGELAVIKRGVPDFELTASRSIITRKLKIELAAKNHPATFTAFDMLCFDDKPVVHLLLMERKALLEQVIVNESARFARSRHIEQDGVIHRLVEEQGLEGVVEKRRDSRYYFDKRTKDWIKIKYLQDDDFVVCGYILKDNNMASLVLGQ